jgi:hypothetical protein
MGILREGMGMSTKHYVNAAGKYIGGFGDGAKPPANSIKVGAPNHGLDIWRNGRWVRHVPEKRPDPDLEGALRLIAVGHTREAALLARLDRES